MTGAPRKPPKVSVVIKAYNHGPYIAQAIKSVLDQSFGDFELLITDDGSLDNTVEVARAFDDPRIALRVTPQNEGISAAMNTTIVAAAGEYIAILNSDDWALPGRLARQVTFLDNHPAISAVFGIPEIVDEVGNPCESFVDFSPPRDLPDYSRTSLLRHFFFNDNFLCAPTAMIRRTVYDQVGLYDRRLTNLQDYDMWIRFLTSGFNIHVLLEPLTAFRIRDDHGNASAPSEDVKLRVQFETFQILRRFADLDSKTFEDSFGKDLGDMAFSSQQEALGLLAVQSTDPVRRLFGLQLLFETSSTRESLEQLRTLAGAVRIFYEPAENRNLLEELRSELSKNRGRFQRVFNIVLEAMGDHPAFEKIGSTDGLMERFDESFYLTNNPDVLAALQLGQVTSGWSHWIHVGIEERRRFRLRPAKD